VTDPVDSNPGREIAEASSYPEIPSPDSRPVRARALRRLLALAVSLAALVLAPTTPCPNSSRSEKAPLANLSVAAPVCASIPPSSVVKSTAAAHPELPLLLDEVRGIRLGDTFLGVHGDEEAPRFPSRRGGSASRLTVVYEALSDCRASLSEKVRWRIAKAIEEQSRRHGYDPLFVQAMVEVESTCSPTARSHRGAVGLIQLQPATARAVARAAGVEYVGLQTLLDPVRNVELGLLYLSQLEEQLGDPHLAVAAYNLGPGRVARMSKGFARSARYVRKILARYEHLLAETLTPTSA
jgi:soluble lytic murein transglycosylase-like protein